MEILMNHSEIDRLDDRLTNSDVTGGEKAHFSRILRDCFRLYNGLVIATSFSIASSLSAYEIINEGIST